tara:strand:- start:1726 stop:2841 length:1116 start_codon:yes stop_codon:yes gene_type:complete
MTINTTTLEANLTTKINNTSGTTDGKEFLLLGKAVEAVNTAISNNSLATANNLSDVANAATARTNLGLGTMATAATTDYAALSGATFTGDVDFGSNKITYANVYSNLSDLPSASTYHGMFAHVHATGKGYYAHGGNWIPIVNEDTSGNVSLGGNLTVTGDFTVNGTQTVLNTSTLTVDDLNITVADGAADAAAANGAGLTVDGASATFNYNSSFDKWTMNKGLVVSGAFTTDSADINGPLNIEEVKEKVIVDTTTTGAIYGNMNLGAVRYYTANQTTNRTISFRGDQGSGISLDSIMAVGDSMTSAFLFTQGSTAYYVNAVYVDGSAPAVLKWVGGAPTGGNANSIDAYTFTVIKTAASTFTVIANQTAYA